MNVTSLTSFRQRHELCPATFHRALELAAAGASVSGIAEELDVSRTTLRDRLKVHEKRGLPGVIKDAFVSPEGEAFLKRLVVVLHVEVRNACAGGLRVIEKIIRGAGLDELLGASLGAQWGVGRAVDEGIVKFGEAQLAAIIPVIEGKEITLACDENFHEGPCLVAMEPASNFIVLEATSPTRSLEDWKSAMVPILSMLGVNVRQITSDCGSSILALAEHTLGAHHSPDLFHILYNFKRTFSPAIRAKRRKIECYAKDAEKELRNLERMHGHWDTLKPEERGRGPAPQFDKLKQEQEEIFSGHMASMGRLEHSEKQVREALKTLSQNYHPVCLTTGRRVGKFTFDVVVKDVFKIIRDVIEEHELEKVAHDALEKLHRMTEKMSKTLENIEQCWRSRSHAASADCKTRFTLESLLAPAAYLERLAKKTSQLKAHSLRVTASKFRAKAVDDLGSDAVAALEPIAQVMSDDFQRSSSMVEGRNGQLSLRHHAFHELSFLKRQVLTTMHNYVQRRNDGTTPSERLSGIKADDLIDWLCLNLPELPKAGACRTPKKAA